MPPDLGGELVEFVAVGAVAQDHAHRRTLNDAIADRLEIERTREHGAALVADGVDAEAAIVQAAGQFAPADRRTRACLR